MKFKYSYFSHLSTFYVLASSKKRDKNFNSAFQLLKIDQGLKEGIFINPFGVVGRIS